MNNKDKDNFYEKKFMRNREKRKNHDHGNGNASNKNHITAIIVSSVLCSIFFIFGILLLFVPSFKALALDYVLMSISSSGEHKDISNADNSISDGITQTIVTKNGEEGKLSHDIYTFLATATDHGENLTDVIMIAKFDSTSNKADILQIPRDTYVKLSGHLIIDDHGNISAENFGASGYETKVNSVYSAGKNLGRTPINNLLNAAKGKSTSEIVVLCSSSEYSYLGISPKMVNKYLEESDSNSKKEIQETMYKSFGIRYLSTFIYYSYGIPIDYYAQVNLKGFRNIVDAIGGVDLYVPQNMYHNDPTQNLYINLKQGYQHLDGNKAEQFVRFRSYTFGDIDRLDAQKSFISAFLSKLSESSISQIQQIATEVLDNLYTNLTLSETANFARQILNMDLSGGFTMTTLPGSPVDVTRNGVWISYYSASKPAVMELVNKNFNKYNINLPAENFGLISLSNADPVFGTTVVGTESSSDSSSHASAPVDTAPAGSKQPEAKPVQKPEVKPVQQQTPTRETESDKPAQSTDVSETTESDEVSALPEDNDGNNSTVNTDNSPSDNGETIDNQITDGSSTNTENTDSELSDVPSDIPSDSSADEKTENEIGTETDADAEPSITPDLETETEPDAGTVSETAPEADADPVPDTETAPEISATPEQAETSVPEVEQAPVISESEPTSTPVPDSNSDAVSPPEAEPSVFPVEETPIAA